MSNLEALERRVQQLEEFAFDDWVSATTAQKKFEISSSMFYRLVKEGRIKIAGYVGTDPRYAVRQIRNGLAKRY